MKTWIMTLPFVCVVSVAMAQGVENGAGADDASAMAPKAAATPAPQLAAASQVQAQAQAAKPRRTAARRTGARARSLPKGDVRHCLDLKTQVGVIRCSESGKNRKQ